MNIHSRNRLAVWFIRVLGWDGLVPVAIWLTPLVIRLIVPQLPIIVEVVAVVLPIVAFFVRLNVGVWYINTNRCGRIVRSVQFVALCCALLVFAVVDAVVILTHVMPKGALTEADLRILFYVYAFYLTCMVMALYPGPGVDDSPNTRRTANLAVERERAFTGFAD